MEIVTKYFSQCSPEQLKQLAALKDLYADWNARINVISRKDMDNFYEHHVLHSLAIASQFQFEKGLKVMDLGAGGGFPGLPLAIFFPETAFFLVDSINKKLKVVNAIANELHINNITTLHTRVEDIKNLKFDSVVSRAVAPLKDLWHWTRPLLKKNEYQSNGLICLKGGNLANEIFESNCKPLVWEIEKIFDELFFNDKFLLFTPLRR
jgi:16S rRNA (guanine527-N7)-methyltransferase